MSLDSIVYCFKDGFSPEAIPGEFKTLKLNQVYGAITYYLENQSSIDEYLRNNAVPPSRYQPAFVNVWMLRVSSFGLVTKSLRPHKAIRTGVLRLAPSVDFQSAQEARRRSVRLRDL